MPLALDTSGRIYDDLNRLQILHSHRATSELVNEFTEESGQFRFLRVTCLTNIKGSVGLILTKVSDPSLCYLCVVLNHEVPDVEICA